MILIHPPVAKPCEPPAGVARLFGFLHRNGIECRVLDANLEGLLALIEVPKAGFDRWTMRAVRNRSRNIESLRSGYAFGNLDRYKRTVMDLNRLLEMPSKQYSIRPGLANYQDRSLTPVRSADLIEAAENPERSPFFHYFAGRLPELIRESSA
ncbi:MAG: hypothetical protein RBR35_19600, partial [Salinivirgaceae bacterium]|nr:hypothetical protein [Salinivirgaceae bacterium]